MCGISGIIDKKGKLGSSVSKKIVKDMLLLINHRGGDSVGIESRGVVTSGHTRLSILDTTSQANQPFVSNNSTLCFNGEIYNHQELRKKYLKYKNISSHSDTATLFGLLEKMTVIRVLNRIKGMHAFSFLNESQNTLSLSIDRYAIKPLYYIDTPDYFAWASEIKAFRALSEFTFEFQDECLEEYLTFRYVAGEKTLFKNIYKLQAGELLTYVLNTNSFKKQKYYLLNKVINKKGKFTEKILTKSVIAHLMADVPIGVQLSGGIDSSLITLISQKFSKKRLHTFSIGLKNDKWNEFYYSNIVARELRTIHHQITFSKKDFVNLFSKVSYHLDEPIVHPNTIPMYLLAKYARKYTKVLLTGEGADEVFYGYNRYFEKDFAQKNFYLSDAFANPNIVSKIIKTKRGTSNVREEVLKLSGKFSHDKKVSFYDIQTYLPHVLMRQDKAGMAANVENRVPFLDKSVVESGLASKYRIGEFGGKTLLKKIALKYFSKEFVLRRKIGFGLPISDWMREQGCLLPQIKNLKKHKMIKKYFVVPEIDKLVKEHINQVGDHSSILFTLLSLIIWNDIFIEPKP